MEILGIGVSELLFVIIIALIFLGPKDMQKAGRTIGKWMRDVVTSDGWKVFQRTSSELRNLPARMMRDANDELAKFNKDIKEGMDIKKPTTPPRSVSTDSRPGASQPGPDLTPSKEPENTILPPSEKTSPQDKADTPKNE
ncbi:MAG TPA: hypothetical protein DCX53_11530 [Anaerolineae bacterium]|nr:hypothetical protein [Anaerolineae bacterium]